MKDLDRNILVETPTTGQTVAASVDFDAVDLRGFNSLAVNVKHSIKTGGDAFDMKIQHSDDNITFVDVPAILLNDAFVTITVAGVQSVGYVGIKRYVRAVATVGTTASVDLVVTYVKGHPENAPTK